MDSFISCVIVMLNLDTTFTASRAYAVQRCLDVTQTVAPFASSDSSFAKRI